MTGEGSHLYLSTFICITGIFTPTRYSCISCQFFPNSVLKCLSPWLGVVLVHIGVGLGFIAIGLRAAGIVVRRWKFGIRSGVCTKRPNGIPIKTPWVTV